MLHKLKREIRAENENPIDGRHRVRTYLDL
jgi:hypothetical protein